MPSIQAAATPTSSNWGSGVEAVLPANAATTKQSAGVRVFCPSAGNCSAVGSYIDGSGNRQGLLLTEMAGAWSPGIQAVLPANAATTQNVFEFDAISCPSAGNCSAVGTYTDTSGSWQGLLLTETAGSWSPAIEAPLPANALSRQMVALLGISCASAGNCTAVGSYFDDSQKLQAVLLTETAGSWATGVEATLPADAISIAPPAFYGSVSCTSAGNCTAVGTYQGSTGTEGLVLTETAGSWASGLEAPLPANAPATWANAQLGQVSCPSAGNCSAIGSYTDSSGNREGLLLTETAGSWSPGIETGLPANAATTKQQTSIAPLSCPSAGNCSGVGSYVDSSGNTEGLLLTETAGAWSPGVEAVLPADAATTGQQASIGPLSCPSAGDRSAVGSYIDGSANTDGLLLTETAGSWATGEVASLPANARTPNASYTLGSVSCPSAGNCSAGGNYADDSSGGNVSGLLIGGSPPAVKLDISEKGSGSGTVSSAPTGIDCGSSCSASFDAGTSLTLTATPSAGSRFGGWSGGGCSGNGTCQANTGISEQTVTATFSLLPKPCVVPKLKGKTLRSAKRSIRTRSCTVAGSSTPPRGRSREDM